MNILRMKFIFPKTGRTGKDRESILLTHCILSLGCVLEFGSFACMIRCKKNNLPSQKKKKWQNQLDLLTHHFIVLLLNGHHTTSHQKLLENDFHHRTPCTKLILQSIGLGNTRQDHKQFNEFQMERSTHAKWKRGHLIADRGNGRVSCNYAPAKHFLTTDQILLCD